MLGAIFMFAGARAIADPEPLTGQAKLVTDRIGPLLERADSRLPSDPRSLIRLNGAVQLAGGVLLATGRFHRPAAVALAGTLVPTTLAAHPFWSADNAVERRQQAAHFLKNLGLFGGLLLAAADTEGRPGLRWRAGHLVDSTQRAMHRGVRTARRDVRLARRAAGFGRHLPG